MHSEVPPWIWFVPLWPLVLLLASAWSRRSKGRPVLFFSVPAAVFQERRASGRAHSHWWTKLGGANNCLVVAVTRDRLVVRPFFPFTLGFLPEFYRLELDVPAKSVVSLGKERAFFRDWVRVRTVDTEAEHDVSLHLKAPDEFMRALEEARQGGRERAGRRAV